MKRTTPPPMRPLRVLLVDDSPEDCEIVVRELTRHDFTVVHERVETHCEMRGALDRNPWDLVVADSTLPGFSGIAALRLLRERGDAVPLIMVSGSGDDRLIREAMRAGARDFIDKRQLARLGSAVDRELNRGDATGNASKRPAGPNLPGIVGTATWTDAKEWLTTHSWPSLNQTAVILEGEAAAGNDWIEELSFREIQLRPAVDAVVAALCKNPQLPPLEPVLRCLVALRLEYARSVAIGYSAAESKTRRGVRRFLPQTLDTLEGRLHWMLIDSWELTGCFQWEAISYWLTDWTGDEPPEDADDCWPSPIPTTPTRSRRRGRRIS